MQAVVSETFIDRLSELPEVSNGFTPIIRTIYDPDIPTEEFISTLSSDKILVTKILQLCNSAFYNFNKKVPGISLAYNLLGPSVLKSLAVLAALDAKRLQEPLVGYNIKNGDFWQHLYITGVCSRYIAEFVNYENSEEAFCAGVIHDIGKLILNNYAFPSLRQAMNLTIMKGYPLWEAEKDACGINHAEISAKIAENWGLPDAFVEAIRYHHESEKNSDNKLLGAILHAANVISIILTQGRKDYYLKWVSKETLDTLQLGDEDLAEVIGHLGNEVSYSWQLFDGKGKV